jgi:hypothetical protein
MSGHLELLTAAVVVLTVASAAGFGVLITLLLELKTEVENMRRATESAVELVREDREGDECTGS